MDAGSQAAFDELFSANYAPLCNFVYSYLHSRDAAEEVVQAVFLRLWEKLAAGEPIQSARAFLFASCRNRALDSLKHERIEERAAEQVLSGEVPPGLGARPRRADEAVQDAELADAIRRAVESLPERCRLVFQLRWQHQLSNTEIAGVLGISVKGVEGHVARALSILRERLAAFRP